MNLRKILNFMTILKKSKMKEKWDIILLKFNSVFNLFLKFPNFNTTLISLSRNFFFFLNFLCYQRQKMKMLLHKLSSK